MVQPEDLYEPEWVEWFKLTPLERLAESAKLWQLYIAAGGALDPDPDPQSPFYFPEGSDASASTGNHARESIQTAWREAMVERRI